MELAPKPLVEKKLKEQARKAGVSLNAYLAPYLNAIAEGSLVMVPHFPPPRQQKS
jgi:predicted HicB family RNase H-like nuclease